MMLEAYTVDVDEYAGKCINATEGGAYIPKTKLMTLQEAIDQYVQKPRGIRSILDTKLAKFTPNPEERNIVSANIKRTLESFRKSLEVCEQAREWIQNVQESPEQAFDKMIRYKIDMQNDHYTWQLYFAHIAQTIFVNHEMYINSILMDEPDVSKAKTKAVMDSKRYFDVIGGLIKICIEDLEGQNV